MASSPPHSAHDDMRTPPLHVTTRAASVPATPGVAVTGLGGGRGSVPLHLPLPFLLTGSLGGALFGLLLPWVAPQALVAPDEPHVLALVHTATLGWLTMTILGATLQLAPVILVSPLHAARVAWLEYPVYTSGVALLVAGFWFWRTPLLIAGGTLVVAAVVHHVVMLGITIARARSHPITSLYLAMSLVYLCVVVCLGLTAALNFQLGFLGAGADHLLLAHITLGVAGWLTCTLIGVSYTLARMFALVHDHDDKLARLIFVLLNAAVIGLAIAFAFAWDGLKLVAGAALVVAVWLFAYDYWRLLRVRKRKPLDVTQRHATVAVAYLVIVMSLGVSAAIAGWNSPRLFAALGLLALAGWLGQSIVGYLYKIVPFLIWQSRYGPLVGKRKVPLMRDLVHQRWAVVSFWLINSGLPVVALSAWGGWSVPLSLASVALGAGLALAAANIIRVCLHGNYAWLV